MALSGWWQPSPPSPPSGSVCPGGANFAFAQSWPTGFKATVTMGAWATGRRVVLDFGAGPTPELRVVGASVLRRSGSTVTFSLGSSPGKIAPDAFDLQGRGRPPDAARVHIWCELPYPPPPPLPASPPAPIESCAPFSKTLQAGVSVVELASVHAGSYSLRITLLHCRTNTHPCFSPVLFASYISLSPPFVPHIPFHVCQTFSPLLLFKTSRFWQC